MLFNPFDKVTARRHALFRRVNSQLPLILLHIGLRLTHPCNGQKNVFSYQNNQRTEFIQHV
jgi:hypothetical protein